MTDTQTRNAQDTGSEPGSPEINLTRDGQGIRLTRNGLDLECFFSASGRLQRKVEHRDKQTRDYLYQFDVAGHLCKVFCNCVVEEEYHYDDEGRRIRQLLRPPLHQTFRPLSRQTLRPNGSRKADNLGLSAVFHENMTPQSSVQSPSSGLYTFHYDASGKLVKAGETTFTYDRKGALASRRNARGITRYFYNKDTLLDEVRLTSGNILRYEYAETNPLGPARRFKNNVLSAEYQWSDPLRLSAFVDHEQHLEYAFTYSASGMLDKVRLTPLEDMNRPAPLPRLETLPANGLWREILVRQSTQALLRTLFNSQNSPLEFLCGCDQVGTPKILTDGNGRAIKKMTHNSFGLALHDSRPELFLPVGFAGGLQDRDIQLVHFGYRDYDPCLGRFTAPDPLGDTGGDHDAYDYCVDDPVTMNDPAGLIAPLLLGAALGAAGVTLGGGIGLAGFHGAAHLTRWIGNLWDGKDRPEITDAAEALTPKVQKIIGIAAASSVLPALMVEAPAAISKVIEAGTFVARWAAAGAITHGLDRFTPWVKRVAEFADGFFMPFPPEKITSANAAGAFTKNIGQEIESLKNTIMNNLDQDRHLEIHNDME